MLQQHQQQEEEKKRKKEANNESKHQMHFLVRCCIHSTVQQFNEPSNKDSFKLASEEQHEEIRHRIEVKSRTNE